MADIENQFAHKFLEGQVTYTLAADKKTVRINAIGYVGIGNLCDSLNVAMPARPDKKKLLLDSIIDTSEKIAMLFIYGGAITDSGNIILPQSLTGDKPRVRLNSNTSFIHKGAAYELAYCFPPNNHGRPSFYLGGEPMSYGINHGIHESLFKTLSKLSYKDHIQFPLVGIVNQNLMFLARVYGRREITD